MDKDTSRLFEILNLSKLYCELCERASDYTRTEFTDRALDLLPRLYWNFFDLSAGVSLEESEFFSEYVEEELYEMIRGSISSVMGEFDTFLETFEEDMKYSDTPITATISENMADIFQPLYNFVNIVHDSEGTQLREAYLSCKEDFENYWSQTLCNVMRALNYVKYRQVEEEL